LEKRGRAADKSIQSKTKSTFSQKNDKISETKTENQTAVPDDKSSKQESKFSHTTSDSFASNNHQTRNNPAQLARIEKPRKKYRDEKTQNARKALRENNFRKLEKTTVVKPTREATDKVRTVGTASGADPRGAAKIADKDISSRLLESVLRKINDTSIARDEAGLVSAQRRRKIRNKQKHDLVSEERILASKNLSKNAVSSDFFGSIRKII